MTSGLSNEHATIFKSIFKQIYLQRTFQLQRSKRLFEFNAPSAAILEVKWLKKWLKR